MYLLNNYEDHPILLEATTSPSQGKSKFGQLSLF